MSTIKQTAMAAAALTVFTFGAAAPSMAAPCRDDGSLGKKVFLGFVELCKKEDIPNLAGCGAAKSISAGLNALKSGLDSIGVTVGNSWLTIGTVETGRFSAKGSPRFTTVKTVDKDSLNVRVTKTGGKGGVAAVVCAIDGSGTTKVGEIEIEDGSREEVGKTITVTGVKDKILQVQLNGIGNIAQTMAFKLNVR